MKDALKRAIAALGFTPDAKKDEVLETPTVVDTLALDINVAVGEELAAKLADFEAAITDKDAALVAALAEVTELKASLLDVTTALKAVSDAKELAESNALAAKLVARKAAVVAALGTDHANAFMAATSAMPDAQFDSVMAAMATNAALEADKPEFTEAGVDAHADVDALVAEAGTSGTGALLAAKYQKQASK